MNFRTIIIFILIMPLFIGCSEHRKDSSHEKFRGLWKLHIIEYQDSSGVWEEHNWNRGGDSYILYDGLGHMSVQITPEGYKDRLMMYPRTKIDSLTIDELRTDLKTYAANYVYTANCVVLEEEQVIEHHRLSHTYPNDWGVVAQRRFNFIGDTLVLMPVEQENPLRLKWIKQH